MSFGTIVTVVLMIVSIALSLYKKKDSSTTSEKGWKKAWRSRRTNYSSYDESAQDAKPASYGSNASSAKTASSGSQASRRAGTPAAGTAPRPAAAPTRPAGASVSYTGSRPKTAAARKQRSSAENADPRSAILNALSENAPEKLQTAVVWSEILGNPVAMRRRNARRQRR